MSTVRSASLRSRSATTTRVPARASRIAAARPLPMPSPAAPPPDTIATLPAKPASSSGPCILSPSGASSPVPVDTEGLSLTLDVPSIGAAEVCGTKQGVALDTILQELAARARRQVLVPAELARPVGVIDLDRVVHDVARERGLAAAVLEIDGDRARRVAGIVLDGEQRVGLMISVD